MAKSMHEVFNEVATEPTREGKANILKKYSSPPIQGILRIAFHPDFKMDLPEGAPPYKRDESIPESFGETTLMIESRRLYLFMKDKDLAPRRKESLFIQMLEGLHYTEADLLIAAKDGQLSKRYKGLTEHIVRLAFPDLLPPKEEKSPLVESKDS